MVEFRLTDGNPDELARLGKNLNWAIGKLDDESVIYSSHLADLTAHEVNTYAKRPTSTVGAIGEWKKIAVADNTNVILPSGGIWAYVVFINNFAAGTAYNVLVSVAAGGTTIYAATVDKSAQGFCWRLE